MSSLIYFQKLLTQTAPLQSEIEAAAKHTQGIKTRLSTAFNVKSFIVGGSYARKTYIRGASDVDLFVVFSRDDMRWGDGYVSSTTALERVRRELEGRFWSSAIYKDKNAIGVDFTKCRIEVVPAFFYGLDSNKRGQYAMPDGNGGWMLANPLLHNAYLRNADISSGGRLFRVARLMKVWCECRTPKTPISSFHIEMLLANEGICQGIKTYSSCIRDALRSMALRNCRAIRDPLGFSGNIPCTKTELQREKALDAVLYSRDHAVYACNQELINPSEAWRQWNIVFNGTFPR